MEFWDNSTLRFYFPHIGIPDEVDSYTPVSNGTIPNLYRALIDEHDNSIQHYSDSFTETGLCQMGENVTLNAPCGTLLVKGLGISCDSQNHDFSRCDEVMQNVQIDTSQR